MKDRKHTAAYLTWDRWTRRFLSCLLAGCVLFFHLSAVCVTAAPVTDDAPLSYQDIDFEFEPEELGQTEGIDAQLSVQTYSAARLPRIYDPRQQEACLLPLKNQRPFGCCWAFSALGACEASLVAKGLADGTVDLSERHLAYYFFKKGAQTADPLGGTMGDYNTNISGKSYLDIGGNSLLTIWHLAGWCGPVMEQLAPYSGLHGWSTDEQGLLGQENTTQIAYGSDAFHLQNAYVIDIGSSYRDETQRDTVKELILEYGALGISYYADMSGVYDNVEKNCYYYDGADKYKTNHAVQVVGWDDTFSREYFKEGHRPDGDGAWLIKNSWGKDTQSLAQDGYFWLSYYDYALRYASDMTNTQKLAYVYDCEPADNYDYIYQYDGDAGHRRFGNGTKVQKVQYLANVFTARAQEGEQEVLRAVGIGISSAGAEYTLTVYTDPDDPANPASGTAVYTQQGYIPFNGYHTIPLEQEILLEYGQRYAVVFAFDEGVYAYVSRSFTNSPWEFITQNQPGCSYVRLSNVTRWIDCADNESYEPCVVRIKAYTDAAAKPRLSQQRLLFTQLGEMAQLTADLPENAPVQWECSAEDVVTLAYEDEVPSVSGNSSVSENGIINENNAAACGARTLRLTALKDGQAVITVRSGGYTASCSVVVDTKEEDPSVYTNLDTGASGDFKEDPKEEQKGEQKEDLKKDPVENPKKEPGSQDLVPARLLSLTMNKSSVSIERGKTYELSAEPVYSRADATGWMVYWKSSDTAVASVDYCGRVTAKKPGTAVITVYNGDIEASCAVTVVPAGQKVAKISVSGDKLKIQLKKQAGVDGYVICRAESENGTYKKVKTLGGAGSVSVSVPALRGSRPYYYKARAYKVIAGHKKFGSYSKVCTVRPAKTAQLGAVSRKNNTVKLTWKKAAYADSYVIYRSTKKNGVFRKVVTVRGAKTVKFTDRKLKKGKTYYYKVRACRKVDGRTVYGAYSAVASVRVR